MKDVLLIINDLSNGGQHSIPKECASFSQIDVFFLSSEDLHVRKNDTGEEKGFSWIFNEIYSKKRTEYKYIGFVDVGVEIEWDLVQDSLNDLISQMKDGQYLLGACLTTLKKEAMAWDITFHEGCHNYSYPKGDDVKPTSDAATGFFLLDATHQGDVFDPLISSTKSFIDATLSLGPVSLTSESFFRFNYGANRDAAGSSYALSLCAYLEKYLVYCENFPTQSLDYRKENYQAGHIFFDEHSYVLHTKTRLRAALRERSVIVFFRELIDLYRERKVRNYLNYSISDPLEKNMFFSKRKEWMYVQSSKCGCTLIKNILARIENNKLSIENEMQIHSKDFHRLKMFRDISTKEVLSFMTSDDVYRFAFVRNPFRRIISCYINKFVHKKDNASIIAIKNYCIDRYSLTAETFDFVHFLKFVREQNSSSMDRHWRPMVDAISYGKINYNFIGKLENFEDDFQKVLDESGLDDSNWKSLLELRNASSYSKPWREYYTQESIDLVKEIYSQDFTAFEYSVELKDA